MTSEGSKDLVGRWIAVVLLSVTAVLLVRAGIIRDPGLHVPPIIAYVCAAVFLLGALAVFQQIIGGPAKGAGVAVFILAGLTIMGAWVALSPASGECSVSINGGAGAAASGLACRVPFGIGALITAAMTVGAAVAWLRGRNR